MVVDKNALMLRDTNGDLLPQEEHSDMFGGTVKILPLTEGDINKFKVEKEKTSDDKLILTYLKDPVLTEAEVAALPLKSKREVVTLILMSSGIPRTQVNELISKAGKDSGN